MFITAAKIHDGRKWLPEGTVIELAGDGTIVAIHAEKTDEHPVHYDGVLAPGFVNVHCHLELSHMKGVIPEHTGLIPFLQNVMMHRNGFSDEQKTTARHTAFNAMLENGIVAVGDITNTTDTMDLRAEDKMHFHSFVETIGFNETPQKQFEYAVHVHDAFAQQTAEHRLWQSIVPHAPYSVSKALFGMIDMHRKDELISIHNQEAKAEDEYYMAKTGGVQTLLHSLGINDDFFKPSGKSSLQTYLEWMSPSHPFIFVHNTYTPRTDVALAQKKLEQVYWCLCPNANLYIENTLPDIKMLMEEHAAICIGTDSLSSNHQLCVLSELASIREHCPGIDWETLLAWGTYNGACALQMQGIVGSIEPGKNPGIVQLHGLYQHGVKPAVTRIV